MDVQRAGLPVVAGVDGSEPALAAVRWAAREAGRYRVPLVLVRAFGEAPVERSLADPYAGAGLRSALLERAEGQLADAAAVAAREVPGLVVERSLREETASACLVAASRSARTVVVGDRGHGGVTGLLAGSVAVGLAARAACPVVVVRGVDRADGPVVVGVDGSPLSEAALRFAVEAAAGRRVPLRAVHVWSDTVLEPARAPYWEWDALEQQQHEILAERLAGWAEKYPDVVVQRVIARDRPARVLLEESAGAGLLVVGSRGRGGLAGFVLGSVSHALVHRAGCPVAVVREEPAGGPA